MDVLWSPWRYDYIRSGNDDAQSSCVFCFLLEDSARTDADKFILHRGKHNFVILNVYPYISGHLMIIPYSHVGELSAADRETTSELMDLTKFAQSALKEIYQPHGFNLGMNLGKAAGAGVAGHLHMHLLPRWFGDSNFTTTIGQTRVIPEDLITTYQKLFPKFINL